MSNYHELEQSVDISISDNLPQDSVVISGEMVTVSTSFLQPNENWTKLQTINCTFTAQLPIESDEPPIFYYCNPMTHKQIEGEMKLVAGAAEFTNPRIIPTFINENTPRSKIYPIGMATNVMRANHLYQPDFNFGPEDGIVCLVFKNNMWQVRFFPKSLIVDADGKHDPVRYKQMCEYAESRRIQAI